MKNKLGKIFEKDDKKWELVGYSDKPTVIFKNNKTGRKIVCVVGSELFREFKEKL